MAFSLTSDEIRAGATVPVEQTCDGADRSPSLRWSDPPEGTRSFALVLDDPDAPGGLFVHWVLWNVPGERRELPAGIAPEPTVLGGLRQGRNDFGRTGHGGPCPPRGHPAHRYRWHLYALSEAPELEPGAATDAAALRRAIAGTTLGTAVLEARYRRAT